MNRILASIAVASALVAGCAATSRTGPPSQAANAVAEPCALRSASRIPNRTSGCAVTPGRSFSQQDIERTGQLNAGDALQMLDPSVTVHH